MRPVLDSIPARFPSLSANVALDQHKVFGLPAVEASRGEPLGSAVGRTGKMGLRGWDLQKLQYSKEQADDSRCGRVAYKVPQHLK
jgi:hypothetical protein